jgi:hypothetical protein
MNSLVVMFSSSFETIVSWYYVSNQTKTKLVGTDLEHSSTQQPRLVTKQQTWCRNPESSWTSQSVKLQRVA